MEIQKSFLCVDDKILKPKKNPHITIIYTNVTTGVFENLTQKSQQVVLMIVLSLQTVKIDLS